MGNVLLCLFFDTVKTFLLFILGLLVVYSPHIHFVRLISNCKSSCTDQPHRLIYTFNSLDTQIEDRCFRVLHCVRHHICLWSLLHFSLLVITDNGTIVDAVGQDRDLILHGCNCVYTARERRELLWQNAQSLVEKKLEVYVLDVF